MKKALIIIYILICSTLYAQNPGNVVRDVPGQSIAKWVCPNNNDILKYSTTTGKFTCSSDATGVDACTTDDTVPVGNGSTADCKSVPDCDDSGGNHLNYDTGTNAFSCGTSGTGAPTDAQYVTMVLNGSLSAERVLTAGTGIDITDGGANDNVTISVESPAGCDRRTCSEYMEDFIGSQASITGTSTTAGARFFNYGWDYSSNTSGTFVVPPGSATTGNTGQSIRTSGVGLSTSTDAAGGMCMGIGWRPTHVKEGSGEGTIIYETAARIEDLSNASHRFTWMTGLGNYTTGVTCGATDLGNTRFISFLYADDINSGKFQCHISDGSATDQDSGITVAADTWYTFRIELDATHSNLNMYISSAIPPSFSSPVCTFTTSDHIPLDDRLTPFMGMRKRAGTSGPRDAYWDYMYLRMDYTSGR